MLGDRVGAMIADARRLAYLASSPSNAMGSMTMARPPCWGRRVDGMIWASTTVAKPHGPRRVAIDETEPEVHGRSEEQWEELVGTC